MADPAVSGEDKATRIKEALDVPLAEPLMQHLGRQKTVLLCLESATEWELVVPEVLVDELFDAEHTTRHCSFRTSQMISSITGSVRLEADGKWTKFEEHHAEAVFGENRPPAWLART